MLPKIVCQPAPRLLAAWAAGPPIQTQLRSCGSCAYHLPFPEASVEEQDHHLDYIEEVRYEIGFDEAHRCHEDPTQYCAGCSKWTLAALAVNNCPIINPTSL
jgi:hypothetical protein